MKFTMSAIVLGAAALLSACVSQDPTTRKWPGQHLPAARRAAQGEVAADQAQITQLQKVVRVTLANGILFPEGGWELDARGKATLDKLAPVLRRP